MSSKGLQVAPGLALPLDAVTQRISFLGRTGSGKSYGAGVLVEEILKLKQQVVILDPKSDWHGLRTSANGKAPGFPITILGGDSGDAPLEPTAGKVVADMVAHERVSLVLDFDHFDSKDQECRFASDFADRLYRQKRGRYRTPMLLVIDEGDMFIPQNPMRDELLMLSRFQTICRRGRKRGIGVVLISQRSAAIHKGALSQTEVMIAHQTTAPQDRKALELWVEGKGTEEQQKQFMQRLASLKTGQAIVWSPAWLDIFQEVKFRAKETYDSSATPRVGVRRRVPKVLAPVDIERLKHHMAETIERARQDDPKLLRDRVQQLERELKGAQDRTVVVPPTPSPRIEPKVKVVEKPVVQTKIVKVKAVTQADLRSIEKVVKRLEKVGKQLADFKQSVSWCGVAIGVEGSRLASGLALAEDALNKLREQKVEEPPVIKIPPLSRRPVTIEIDKAGPGSLIPGSPGDMLARAAQALEKVLRPLDGDVDAGAATKDWTGPNEPQRRVLQAIADFEALGLTPKKSWVAARASASYRSSTFHNNCSALKRYGLVAYPAPSRLKLTQGGRGHVVASNGHMTNHDVLASCLAVISKSQGAILLALHAKWPHDLTQQELVQEVGASIDSSTFHNNLSALTRGGMMDRLPEKRVKCADWMFVERRVAQGAK